MKSGITGNPLLVMAVIVATSMALASCASTAPTCGSPQAKNLSSAIPSVQASLMNGCQAHFERYYDELLTIAEGDPGPGNKREFSEFLVWANDSGLLSNRQAENYYNRYFNVKFMAMKGDYNNCSNTCPNKQRVLLNMQHELSDKERGLMKISRDADAYYRADKLFQEIELVLEATCTACSASR